MGGSYPVMPKNELRMGLGMYCKQQFIKRCMVGGGGNRMTMCGFP